MWSHPETDARLKKRIVRTLIEEVVVDIDDHEARSLLSSTGRAGCTQNCVFLAVDAATAELTRRRRLLKL